jgi:hypothetical protein
MLPVSIIRPLATVAVSIALAVSARPPSTTGPGALPAYHADSPPAESASRSIPFDAEFTGLDADRGGLVWRGHIRGVRGDDLTLTIKPLCTPLASAEPVWPVRVRWAAAGANSKTVSVADLEGIVDWKSHRLHVDGTVVEGSAKGRQVTLHAMFRDLDPEGVLTIVSQRVIAGRADSARSGISSPMPARATHPPVFEQSAAAPHATSGPHAARPLLNPLAG